MNFYELNKRVQKRDYKTRGNWMVRTFLRDWAVPCTWVCLRLGISADQVTAGALAAAIAGSALASFSEFWPSLTGIFLIQLWYYLDHVDGQIARYHGTDSLTGRFFDFVMHHLVHGILYFCLILYMFHKTQVLFYLYAAGFSAVCVVVFNLLYDIEYKVFFEKMSTASRMKWRFKERKSLDASLLKSPLLYSAAKNIFSIIHKLNEVHVAMNLLTLAVVLSLAGFDFVREGLACFYALTPPVLVAGKLFFLVSRKQIDSNYVSAFLAEEIE